MSGNSNIYSTKTQEFLKSLLADDGTSISSMTASDLTVTSLSSTNASITNASINDLYVTTGEIVGFISTNATITNLQTEYVSVEATSPAAIDLKDSACTDNDTNVSIYTDVTDTGSGTEDVDVYFAQQIDGTLTDFLHADADGDLDFQDRNIVTTGNVTASAYKTSSYTLTVDETKSVSDKANKLITETSEKDADYTLSLTDADKIVLMNKTGAATLTVPTNASVAFPIGTIVGVYNVSADAVTITGDAGVTVRNTGDLAQYGEVSLRKRATDEWVLAGVVS